MNLLPDWREFIELLNSHGVDYVIVGAWARAFHGISGVTSEEAWAERVTGDLGARRKPRKTACLRARLGNPLECLHQVTEPRPPRIPFSGCAQGSGCVDAFFNKLLDGIPTV